MGRGACVVVSRDGCDSVGSEGRTRREAESKGFAWATVAPTQWSRAGRWLAATCAEKRDGLGCDGGCDEVGVVELGGVGEGRFDGNRDGTRRKREL